MKRFVMIMLYIIGGMYLKSSCIVYAQSPNEVYRNELIGVIIRYEGSEGGYDWAFVKALPNYVVSFDYKGIQVTLRGLIGQRFIRKDYPIPRGFKLSDSQVIVDGFPATNYNNYMRYYNTLYDATNDIGKRAQGDKQKLQEAIKVIDYKIAEISKQSTSFQVSPEFRQRHSFDHYIDNLKRKRKSFEDDIMQIDKKKESSTIVIAGTNSEKAIPKNANTEETSNVSKEKTENNKSNNSIAKSKEDGVSRKKSEDKADQKTLRLENQAKKQEYDDRIASQRSKNEVIAASSAAASASFLYLMGGFVYSNMGNVSPEYIYRGGNIYFGFDFGFGLNMTPIYLIVKKLPWTMTEKIIPLSKQQQQILQ